jgi:hypothetical protein
MVITWWRSRFTKLKWVFFFTRSFDTYVLKLNILLSAITDIPHELNCEMCFGNHIVCQEENRVSLSVSTNFVLFPYWLVYKNLSSVFLIQLAKSWKNLNVLYALLFNINLYQDISVFNSYITQSVSVRLFMRRKKSFFEEIVQFLSIIGMGKKGTGNWSLLSCFSQSLPDDRRWCGVISACVEIRVLLFVVFDKLKWAR